jgi:phage shock protein A
MGFFSRLMIIIRAKSNGLMNRAEDPIEMLEYVDDQQRDMVRRLKQGIIEVAISKRQLQQHVDALQKRVPQLEEQARQAMSVQREDLARIALERKQTALAELERLTEQVAGVELEEQRLVGAEHRLSARIDEFKTKRQTLSARYSAAEAQVAVKEALTGVSGEFAELSMALGRAEEKIEYMIAKASAIDDLIDTGGVTSLTSSSVDVVERELKEITARYSVEDELKALQSASPNKGANNGTGD